MCNYALVFTLQMLVILFVTRTAPPEKFAMLEPVFVVMQMTLPLVRMTKCATTEPAMVSIIVESYVHCLTEDFNMKRRKFNFTLYSVCVTMHLFLPFSRL